MTLMCGVLLVESFGIEATQQGAHRPADDARHDKSDGTKNDYRADEGLLGEPLGDAAGADP